MSEQGDQPAADDAGDDQATAADAGADKATAADAGVGDEQRREFMAKAASFAFGGIIVAIPAGAGLATLLSPLSAPGQKGLKRRLASVSDLPEDGTPVRYDVVSERKDAWTRYPKKAVGSVWLRRLPDGGVLAFNTSCPHLGCAVGYEKGIDKFSCPCHMSVFGLDGERLGESVSPRGMDSLEVDQEKLQDGEVWVTFMNFRTKIGDKVPV